MHAGFVWAFAAALAFAGLCLGLWLRAEAELRQSRRAAEKYRTHGDAQTLRLRDANRELDALKRGRAA